LIVPANGGGAGGIWSPSIVVLALGDLLPRSVAAHESS
jgi:hypothetical protein